MKKLRWLILISMFELQLQAIHRQQVAAMVSSTHNASDMIATMQQAIDYDDKLAFEELVCNYINNFGQVYEKQGGMLESYITRYYITSQEDQSQLLTPAENSAFLELLNRAEQHDNWKSDLIIRLSVLNPKTLLSITKQFSLHEIIDSIKQIQQPARFSQNQIISAAALTALALGSGLYFFAQQNPELIQQTADSLHYGWQDLQNSTHHMFKKYFTDPQNYEQFEKEHDLLSKNMTNAERQQRFKEWQTGEQIQQGINNTMKEVQRFEKKLNLPSENMMDDDRIAILKEWKKQERDAQRLHGKMKPIEQFEKKHNLISENMSETDRQKRFKEWRSGDRKDKTMQENMKEVKAFEKEHDLLSENMAEDSRLQRFREWQRGDLRQKDINEQLKEVAAWEKAMNLSAENMQYEDRIKIFEAAKEIDAHEKVMHGLEKWEDKHSWHVRYYGKAKTEEERIERYLRSADPLMRYFLENDLDKMLINVED